MKYTILVVEDEKVLSNALVSKLTREGFTMITAENGEEGLASALKNHPDLILLDIIMPVMDGLAMLRELRKDPWGERAKVILLTNLSDPGKVTEELVNTVSGCLVKSDWKIEDVVKQVREKLT